MTSKQIRLITIGISLASGILAVGDKWQGVPGIPGWLASSWWLVLIGAKVFNEVAHILIDPVPPVVTPLVPAPLIPAPNTKIP